MRLSRCCRVGVLILLAVGVVLLPLGCSEGVSSEEVVTPLAELVVYPPCAEIGATVTVLGSGLTSGDTVRVRIRMGSGVPVGVTHVLTPAPEVGDCGAFASELSLKSYTAGTYTVELVVDDEVVATAPLSVMEPTE